MSATRETYRWTFSFRCLDGRGNSNEDTIDIVESGDADEAFIDIEDRAIGKAIDLRPDGSDFQVIDYEDVV